MSRNRKRLWLVVKSALALVIIAAIGRHFWKALSDPALSAFDFTIRTELLLPAGLLSLASQCCWGSFWVRLLRSQGVPVTWYAGMRAYFVSQFGKYVPGKALSILMRIAMLRGVVEAPRDDPNAPATRTDNWFPVAVTATYETLTSMAAGAMIAVALLPFIGVLPAVVSRNIAWVVVMAGLPIALAVLNKFAARIAAKRRGPDAPPLPTPRLRLLAQGLLHGTAGWCLLGLSTGLVIRAVLPEPAAPSVAAFLGDLAATTLSYIAGFVFVVAPGGIGARELVLEYAIAPRYEPSLGPSLAHGLAIVIAITLRLTWTAFELALAFGLYLGKPTVHSTVAVADKEGVHA